MATPYELGTSETVWEDDCSSCPSYILFDDASKCERLDVVDDRCFRGEWGAFNDYFEYYFQLPPEWSAPVSVTYSYKYWALGEWDSKVSAGSSHYEGSSEDLHFMKTRPSSTTCNDWMTWTAPSGSFDFDPYTQWGASDGTGGHSLACYYPRTSTFSLDVSNFGIEFWTWDGSNTGIQGPRADMAWAVSDFRVQFTPESIATTTTIKPTTTIATTTAKATTTAIATTTSKPTTTTSIPTTTSKPTTTTSIPTTTSKPTTTTSAPTTTTSKPTTTTSIPTSTEGPQTTTHTPTEAKATTSTFAETSRVQTSASPTQDSTEDSTTSGEVDSGGNSSNGFGLSEIALLSVGGGVMVALLFFLVVYVLRKNKAKEDGDCETVNIKMTRVISAEQMDEGKCEESEGDAEELHGTVEIKVTVERKQEPVGEQPTDDAQCYATDTDYEEEEAKAQEYVTAGADFNLDENSDNDSSSYGQY